MKTAEFVTVDVTAICYCGTTWHCQTTMRHDIANDRPAQVRMASCSLCAPLETNGDDELRQAAQDVVDAWYDPSCDTLVHAPTRIAIHRLQAALAATGNHDA